MTEWTPISIEEIYDKIHNLEKDSYGELFNFWQLIKIDPTKWIEKQFGEEGGGFWAVAVCGTKVIWFNDIEDGFNISDYKTYGQIEVYNCNQDELSLAVSRLLDLIKFGGDLIGQASQPINLT